MESSAFFRATAAAINPIPSANQTGLFERPYGFAWLLELAAELHTWPDTQAKRWSANIAPLATWMADSLGAYFTKLVEPIRSGAQANTALNMTLALDYADDAHDAKLRAAVVSTARKFYLADSTCSTQSERVVAAAGGRGGRGGRGGVVARTRIALAARLARPTISPRPARGRRRRHRSAAGGAVIVSPCLSEAALMSRVLEPRAYVAWLGRVLPPLQSGRFAPLTEAISHSNGGSRSGDAAPPRPIPRPRGRSRPLLQRQPRLATSAPDSPGSRSRARRRWSASRARFPRPIRASPRWHRLSAIQADRGFELMRDDQAGAVRGCPRRRFSM